MTQLWLHDSAPGPTQWTSGVSEIEIHAENGPYRLPISVPCRLGELEETHFALLDTGSARTIVGGELVELLDDQFGPQVLPEVTIQSRLGGWALSGPLHELQISLPSLLMQRRLVSACAGPVHRNPYPCRRPGHRREWQPRRSGSR